ncbi:mechanosensitive ion channel [Oenococcus sp. UCMA 16435]|nr:mechanosensitive ion channel [Oenococcus sp. UCMA 16435]MDI4583788.1 mechanosensitive ion channel [Oenococcus sp. UCMA 14587]
MITDNLIKTFANYWQKFKWETIGPKILDSIIQIIIYSIIFWIINRLVIFLVDRSFNTYLKSRRINKKRANTIHTLARNTVRYFIVFFYLYTILSVLGFPIGTLVASAGIVTVVVGLGAQSIIRDVISGFLILLEQQMEVGDNVIINNDISGRVTAFGLRITTIKDTDGGLNYITNSSITTINNQSRANMRIQIDIPIKDVQESPFAVKAIKNVNENILNKNNSIISQPQIQAPIVLESNNTFGITIVLFVKNGQQAKIKTQLTTSYLKAIEKEELKKDQKI